MARSSRVFTGFGKRTYQTYELFLNLPLQSPVILNGLIKDHKKRPICVIFIPVCDIHEPHCLNSQYEGTLDPPIVVKYT